VSERLELRNLYKIFGKKPAEALDLLKRGETKDSILARTGAVIGVNNVSLKVPAGTICVVMGLSGSGKSTLARCVNRILEPDAGQIFLDGRDIIRIDSEQLREIRRHRISMVFQNFGLLPNLNVIDNVAFGLKLRGVPVEERKAKAGEVLEVVGLSAWASHPPSALSGGMRQRVGLARALATDADIMIMDEAFSALDPLIRAEMQDELLRLQNSLHKTVFFITHDFQEALRLGTRIAIMSDGALVREGTPQEIVLDPQHDYVAAFTRNVDRSRLFDAASIMTPDRSSSAGPEVFVLDGDGRILGWRSPRDGSLSEDYVTVRPEAKLIEIASLARGGRPIAVVDEAGLYRGAISPGALLAGIAGDPPALNGGVIANA